MKKLRTYTTLRGLLVAKAKGTAPRGIKIREVVIDGVDEGIDFVCGGTVLLSLSPDKVVRDFAKRLGFAMAK